MTIDVSTQNSEQKTAQQIRLGTSIMAILDNWKLSGEEILSVLSLPDNIKVRHLGQYRKDRALPDTEQVNKRVGHIIGITEALHTSYPTNPHMAQFWLNKKTKRFKDKTPLEVITTGGLEGLIDIRKHLDCSYDWFND
ncbi:MAG: DUF2384 domain-containing protein [Pseudomonadota bacterium]